MHDWGEHGARTFKSSFFTMVPAHRDPCAIKLNDPRRRNTRSTRSRQTAPSVCEFADELDADAISSLAQVERDVWRLGKEKRASERELSYQRLTDSSAAKAGQQCSKGPASKVHREPSNRNQNQPSALRSRPSSRDDLRARPSWQPFTHTEQPHDDAAERQYGQHHRWPQRVRCTSDTLWNCSYSEVILSPTVRAPAAADFPAV